LGLNRAFLYSLRRRSFPDAEPNTEREELMNSSLISKIEKAKRYAAEPDRVQFKALEATFRGDNGTHTIRLSGDEWICECDHFVVHGLCSHVMTLQRLFAANLSDAARYTQERLIATA
jgi:hypothetical protein